MTENPYVILYLAPDRNLILYFLKLDFNQKQKFTTRDCMAGCYFIEYLFFFFNIKEVNFSFFKEILLSFMTYIRYFSTTLTVQKKNPTESSITSFILWSKIFYRNFSKFHTTIINDIAMIDAHLKHSSLEIISFLKICSGIYGILN